MSVYLPPNVFNNIKDFIGLHPAKYINKKISKLIKTEFRRRSGVFAERKSRGRYFAPVENEFLYNTISMVEYYGYRKHCIFSLREKTRPELALICKENNIKRYSKLRKAQLLTLIIKL